MGEDRVAAFEREFARRLEAANSLSDEPRADDRALLRREHADLKARYSDLQALHAQTQARLDEVSAIVRELAGDLRDRCCAVDDPTRDIPTRNLAATLRAMMQAEHGKVAVPGDGMPAVSLEAGHIADDGGTFSKPKSEAKSEAKVEAKSEPKAKPKEKAEPPKVQAKAKAASNTPKPRKPKAKKPKAAKEPAFTPEKRAEYDAATLRAVEGGALTNSAVRKKVGGTVMQAVAALTRLVGDGKLVLVEEGPPARYKPATAVPAQVDDAERFEPHDGPTILRAYCQAQLLEIPVGDRGTRAAIDLLTAIPQCSRLGWADMTVSAPELFRMLEDAELLNRPAASVMNAALRLVASVCPLVTQNSARCWSVWFSRACDPDHALGASIREAVTPAMLHSSPKGGESGASSGAARERYAELIRATRETPERYAQLIRATRGFARS